MPSRATRSAALSGAELYQSVALERDRNDAILSNIADGIVAVDRDGHVVLWNRAAEEITGVPPAEALGRAPSQILQRELESAGETSGGERLVSIPRGAEEIWLSLTEAVMRDPTGAVAGRIFAFRDISAERVVEQMKSEFVTNVSRELRSPLTSIYGFAETLLRDDVLFGEEERGTFLGYIASESGRLKTIVDRLLSVARLDAGDLQVHLAVTDVGSLIREWSAAPSTPLADATPSCSTCRRSPSRRRPTRRSSARSSPTSSRTRSSTRPTAARSRFRRVAAARGSRSASTTRASASPSRSARSSSGSSTGRTPTVASSRARGTGLGLFIAKEWLEAMHGRIWVQPREERRLEFGFVLPADGGSSGERAVMRVLVIDDEPPIRLLCRVNLEAEQMQVREAGDGPTGLEQARNEEPDVILLDVMMPGLDGWQVAEELLSDERTRSIPIIFLTARAEARDRARGLDLGGIDYVTKPFNPTELAPLIRELVGRVDRGEREEVRREKIAELRDLIEPS